MEDVGIFYGHLFHSTVFCYILSTFSIVRGNLVYFFPVLVFCTKKNLATLIPVVKKIAQVCIALRGKSDISLSGRPMKKGHSFGFRYTSRL
jgi:hypothetical protein